MNAGTIPSPSYAALVTNAERQLARIEHGMGARLAEALAAVVRPALEAAVHGDFAAWQRALDRISSLPQQASELHRAAPQVDCELNEAVLREVLEELTPWRKGPFQLGPVLLDAEWDGALKWERFQARVPVADKRVLDVGAGNGYFMLRAVGAGARFVLGIDPSWHSNVQWALLQRLFQCEQAALLPLRLSAMPETAASFDVALSMGVLYHQRDPLSHIAELRRSLVAGGQLVLETLVHQVPESTCLVPSERYAAMRNVWFIPSPACVENWLRRSGFEACEVLDVTPTTSDEQRTTPWMRAPSLRDFLDPKDPARTLEGYPAPVRAVFLAR